MRANAEWLWIDSKFSDSTEYARTRGSAVSRAASRLNQEYWAVLVTKVQQSVFIEGDRLFQWAAELNLRCVENLRCVRDLSPITISSTSSPADSVEYDLASVDSRGKGGEGKDDPQGSQGG